MSERPDSSQSGRHVTGAGSAVLDSDREHSHAHLEAVVRQLATAIAELVDVSGAGGAAAPRVTYHVPPSFAHIALQHAIWQSGAVAVPLALSHPAPELEY